MNKHNDHQRSGYEQAETLFIMTDFDSGVLPGVSSSGAIL